MTGPALIIAGGTISMAGPLAEPADAEVEGLVAALSPAVRPRSIEVFSTAPSVHYGAQEALALARRASDAARATSGVVVTFGTDLMEEVAFLTDLVHAGEHPVVFTGAMRPAAAPGADGPANLSDSLAVVASPSTRHRGVLVCMAGEVHRATEVRKMSSTGVASFASPTSGPIGFVNEGRVTFCSPPPTPAAPLSVHHMTARVEIFTVGLDSDARTLGRMAEGLDGLVLSLPGAGHTPPGLLATIREVCSSIPVIAVARPAAGYVAHATYGYRGSEQDVRRLVTACAGRLSAAAARVKLTACLGAGLDLTAVADEFSRDDT